MGDPVRWECPKCGENNKDRRTPFQVGYEDAKKGVDRNPYAAGTIAWTRYRNGQWSAGAERIEREATELAVTVVDWAQMDLFGAAR